MGRWDYTEAFPLGNRKLNVVICIYQKMGYSRKNRINEMLEAIQTDLKKKLTCYEKVQTAYVYEAPLLTVKKFEKLTEETVLRRVGAGCHLRIRQTRSRSRWRWG